MPIHYNALDGELRAAVRNPRVGRGKTYYVHANDGSDGDSGRTWNSAFATLSKAFNVLSSGDTIVAAGKFKEQLSTPAGVFDVTMIGAGNLPRHADDSPTPTGGKSAFTWTKPDSPTAATPLVKVQQQGWRFENMLFAGPTDSNIANACIQLHRTAEGDDERDASHLSIVGCRFASGYNGIYDSGGCAGVRIEDSFFNALTSFCVTGVGNIGVGQVQWYVKENRFLGFTNGVKIAALDCVIRGNFFSDGGTPATTVVLNTVNASGGNNFIVRNYFQGTTANFNSPDIEGNATDVWIENYAIDSTSAGVGGNFEAGQPA